MATSDPIAEIIGDYRAFAEMQREHIKVPLDLFLSWVTPSPVGELDSSEE